MSEIKDTKNELAWQTISSGNTKGVFQLETPLGKKWSRKLKPQNIEELSDLVSLMRPGSLYSGMADKYVNIKNNNGQQEYIDEKLISILNSTKSCLVYQEQLIEIVKQLAGFSLQEADLLRECIDGEAYFITPDGPKKVNGSIPGDIVLTKNGFKPIKNIISRGVRKVIKIGEKHGFNLFLTKDHKIYTNYGWKSIDDDIRNIWVATPRNIKFNEKKIPESIVSIITFLLSEGHTTNKRGWTFCNSETKVLNLFNNYCSKISKEHNKKKYKQNYNSASTIYIKKKIKNLILQFGYIESLSRFKEFPSWIYNLNNYLSKILLTIFFITEGEYVKNHRVVLNSTSEKMLLQIKYILLKFGIFSYILKKKSIYKNKPYQSFRLYITGRFYKLFTKILINKILRCSHKYKDIIESKKNNINYSSNSDVIPNPISRNILTNKNLRKNKSLLECGIKVCGKTYSGSMTYDNLINICKKINIDYRKYTDVIWRKCNSLEESKKEVFDFEIDSNNLDEQNAFVNGILVHNCVGKKKKKMLEEIKPKFINGCKNNGISEVVADKIYEWLKESSDYLFNKCISTQTIVELDNGKFIRIVDLKVGKKIRTVGNTFTTVKNIYYNGIRPCVRIVTSTKKILVCTWEHKILSVAGMKTLKEIVDKKLKIITENEIETIKLVEPIGTEETCDIEVTHSSHAFSANGIFVSNSHALSYALLGYKTAYYKSNYPLEFFCSMLIHSRNCQAPMDEMKDIIIDARNYGILIEIPHINQINKEFEISSNNTISYGMSHVKHIGSKSIHYLDEFKDVKNMGQFYATSLSKRIPSPIIEALIMGGTLDHMCSNRKSILLTWNLLREMTSRELSFVILKLWDGVEIEKIIQEIINKGSKGEEKICSNKNRIIEMERILKEIIEQKDIKVSFKEMEEMEISSLGLSLKYHETQDYQLNGTKSCSEAYLSLGGREKFQLLCRIERIGIIQCKKGKHEGEEMAFLTISDSTSVVDNAILFPEAYAKEAKKLQMGKICLFSCSKYDPNYICINKIQPL